MSSTEQQASGIERTDLQQHDLSIPGREVVQNRVDISPEAPAFKHKHPGEEIMPEGDRKRLQGESVLNTVLMQLQYPSGQGEETAVEFAILESKLPVCTEVPRTGILGKSDTASYIIRASRAGSYMAEVGSPAVDGYS